MSDPAFPPEEVIADLMILAARHQKRIGVMKGFTFRAFVQDLEWFLDAPVADEPLEDVWLQVLQGIETGPIYNDDAESLAFEDLELLEAKYGFVWECRRVMEALLSAKQLAVKPANDSPLREIDGDVWLRLRGGHLMFDLLEAIAAIHTADYMSPFGASSRLSLERYLPKGPPSASQSTFPVLGR